MDFVKILTCGSSTKTVSLILLFFSLGLTDGKSQDEPERINNSGRLSVFLDMPYRTDEDFIRQEIPVVDYVRDKAMADVHVIMTQHRTGTGNNYAASFIGYGTFENTEYELSYWDDATNTSDETRRGYTKMIKIGLAPFIAKAGMVNGLTLQYDEFVSVVEDVKDPWNQWIFELFGSGYFTEEETRNSYRLYYGASADKITEEWKIRLRSDFRYDERNFFNEDETITSISTRDRFDGYVLKSLTNHWSAGIFAGYRASTYSNMAHSAEASPALEYSIFPYSEATRRSITVSWRMGSGYYDYIDTTIFNKTEEYLFEQSIDASADFEQTWGSLYIGLEGSHHFHDYRSNRLEFSTSINLRLLQGLSLRIRGEYELINDQVAIPKEDLSLEEILLEQRRRATDYELSGSIGLSYTFGSRITGIYNPRF